MFFISFIVRASQQDEDREILSAKKRTKNLLLIRYFHGVYSADRLPSDIPFSRFSLFHSFSHSPRFLILAKPINFFQVPTYFSVISIFFDFANNMSCAYETYFVLRRNILRATFQKSHRCSLFHAESRTNIVTLWFICFEYELEQIQVNEIIINFCTEKYIVFI